MIGEASQHLPITIPLQQPFYQTFLLPNYFTVWYIISKISKFSTISSVNQPTCRKTQ